jgi:hypothetical protein
MKYIFLAALTVLSFTAFADETPAAAAEDTANYGADDVGVRWLVGSLNFPGFEVDANHRLTPHWSIGAALWEMRNSVSNSEGGSLDSGQYYGQYVDQQSAGLEAVGTYYFRENGARRWGPLLHGGVGWAYRQAQAVWERYDHDPAFFTFFGDKRKLDSGLGSQTDWSGLYARIGADFQFALGKKSLANGHGHLLQVGFSGIMPFDRKTAIYTKPTTGETVAIRQPAMEVMFEVSYAFVF